MSAGKLSQIFPYMHWARTESFGCPYSLAQSGIAAPDPSFLGPPTPTDLGPPPMEAMPQLRQRLAELYGVSPGRVLVVPGASAGMFLLASRFFRPGTRVVTELPSYEPFRVLPQYFGADMRAVRRRAEDNFRLDLDAAQDLLRGAAPAHLFLSNPHNPTGVLSSPEDITRLAEAAGRSGGHLISNEIYMEFAQPERRFHAFELSPHGISISGLTKAYGLGALRIGWIIFGEACEALCAEMEDLAFLGWIDPATHSMRAARKALDHLPQLLAPARKLEAECRPHLQRWLRDCPHVIGPAPALGLSAFPRLCGIEDTQALAAHLAQSEGVGVVAGEFFGLAGHLRISYGLPEATLREGLARLTRGIESYLSQA